MIFGSLPQNFIVKRNRENQHEFTARLMDWHRRHNTRTLPWKEERDPYKIWLSEIILQQTRAAQGLPYYQKFIAAFPCIEDLAAAPDDAVFKLWEGLGYYSRCRNLLTTARFIAGEHNGVFPDSYEGILRLKGVGPYTAAAIASFAFGLPNAVVDGNVYRVLARVFGVRTPTDSSEGKKEFQSLADKLLDVHDPGGFNQAMMDLGATVCLPQSPRCEICPVEEMCIARREGLIDLLPIRTKRQPVKTRFFHFIILRHGHAMWLQQRSGDDIWRGLYQPLLIEADAPLDAAALQLRPELQGIGSLAERPDFLGEMQQRLTHQLICSRFFELRLGSAACSPHEGFWLPLSAVGDYAMPRTLKIFFEKMATFKVTGLLQAGADEAHRSGMEK